MNTITNAQLRQTIVALLARRSAASSICPSDAARAISAVEAQWRALMPQVRAVAFEMAAEQEVLVTRRGKAVAGVGDGHGAIRIGRGANFPEMPTDGVDGQAC